MKYRINYGNGQVSNSFEGTRGFADKELERDRKESQYGSSAFLEQWINGYCDDPGYWQRVKVQK